MEKNYFIQITENKTYLLQKPGNYMAVFVNFDGEATFLLEHEKIKIWVLGLYRGEEGHRFKSCIRLSHRVSNCESFCLVKSVLADKSGIDFAGVIQIQKNTKNNRAYLRHNNLMLSENAHCDSYPILQIDSHEVACTHASTSGPISEADLYHLAVRGVSPQAAQKLIVKGFMAEVYDLMKAKANGETQVIRQLQSL